MLIIDKNLSELVRNKKICDQSLIDNACLQIRLSDETYYKFKENKELKVIRYGIDNESRIYETFECIDNYENNDSVMILNPGECVLASSLDKYSIPNNVFGLVQTKGSLARIFVQITCNDGQIEPGFTGNITLEITNLSPCIVEIPFKQKIGQLYLFSCSMQSSSPYNGKYANSSEPTLPNFKDM